jgi:hypothetical protein
LKRRTCSLFQDQVKTGGLGKTGENTEIWKDFEAEMAIYQLCNFLELASGWEPILVF